VGVLRQQFWQKVRLVRNEMLDEDERHIALRRHPRKELLERFQPACGCAQAHDGARRTRRLRRLGLFSRR
jgi:hypothetical protein